MSNPDHLGELSYLYYYDGDYDLTQPDATILTDTPVDWSMLCVVDVSTSRSRTLQDVVDRCVGDEKEYTGGKRETSVTINLNELRLTPAMVRAWQAISDSSSVIGLLVLNDQKDVVTTYGFIGNWLVEQDDDTQPAEGNNTNALTFRPAARSQYEPKVRRIYGSGVA